jgi:phosphatidylglycerophosphate synthase
MNIKKWNKYHCFAMFAASLIFIINHSFYPFLIISLVSFSLLWVIGWPEIRQINGGLANWVTAIRYFGLVILSFLYLKLTGVQITTWLIILVILDGLDGYLARKFHHRTKMGAYFDMETDALFICIVSCILLIRGLTRYYILIPAFMRYFYVVLLYMTGLQVITEERTRFGPAVAVIMFLILAFAFVLPGGARFYLLVTGSIMISGSFIYSFVSLVKNKKAQNLM